MELTRSCLDRIDELNPTLNAIIARADEKALDQARIAETEILDGTAEGILHGLPVAIKDMQATEGLTTTYGTAFYKDNVPSEDSGIVARVKARGELLSAKPTSPR